jgi:hypothetical protein
VLDGIAISACVSLNSHRGCAAIAAPATRGAFRCAPAAQGAQHSASVHGSALHRTMCALFRYSELVGHARSMHVPTGMGAPVAKEMYGFVVFKTGRGGCCGRSGEILSIYGERQRRLRVLL